MAIDLLKNNIAAIVSLLGFSATIVTLLLYHMRARRELAVTLMLDWANNYDATMKSCIKLASDLNSQEIQKIWMGEEFQLDGSYREFLIAILAEAFDKDALSKLIWPEGAKTIVITKLHASYIEYNWTRYLNRLEATLSAWSSGVAHEGMMEFQFKKLLKLRRELLQGLIDADPESNPGDRCHPTIRDFLKRIENNQPLPGSGGPLSVFSGRRR